MMQVPFHPGRHHLYNGSSGTFLPVKEGNEAMATVTFDNATRQYPGNPVPSVDKLNIEIADGEFLVLVGPSGCGKSTSLRMLAGLEEVNAGRILIGDRDVTNLSPKDRDVAMVFQNYALYPHMTVADNMGFALKIAGVDKAEIRKRVEEASKILDLTPYLDRKPKALSGGQRQRVAMGRAIVRSPQVFLMDEPLSNLDAKLRVQTRTQIASLQRRLGVTTVYVTHDQVEAMTMGDRVAVLKDGILQQCDSPRRMYDHPANVFVAGFIGSPAMNLMNVPVNEAGVDLHGHTVPIAREDLSGIGRDVTIGVRPEDLELSSDASGIPVTVDVVEELGADAYIYGSTEQKLLEATGENAGAVPFIARVDGRRPPEKGEKIYLKPKPGHVHVFNSESGLRVGD
ncbi:sn-glycerol-3-phosphate ABC transporter ATP-binding protein UgpC [Terrabacter lapilli]|uniref:Sn-glycerol-3-phosphate ABC transporter ATP-binding protein UgpC n=2 Tax=Terrabacter lapilli TaxID=436231 RepID=A0ABN2SBY7_9MICO